MITPCHPCLHKVQSLLIKWTIKFCSIILYMAPCLTESHAPVQGKWCSLHWMDRYLRDIWELSTLLLLLLWTLMALTDLLLKLYVCGESLKMYDSTKYFNDHYKLHIAEWWLNFLQSWKLVFSLEKWTGIACIYVGYACPLLKGE